MNTYFFKIKNIFNKDVLKEINKLQKDNVAQSVIDEKYQQMIIDNVQQNISKHSQLKVYTKYVTQDYVLLYGEYSTLQLAISDIQSSYFKKYLNGGLSNIVKYKITSADILRDINLFKQYIPNKVWNDKLDKQLNDIKNKIIKEEPLLFAEHNKQYLCFLNLFIKLTSQLKTLSSTRLSTIIYLQLNQITSNYLFNEE